MKKRLAVLAGAAMVGCLLCGCSLLGPDPNAAESKGNAVAVSQSASKTTEEITMVVTPTTIVKLESFPNLKRADLTGSTCYEVIENYMAKHPQVAVTYTVDLGGTQVHFDAEEATLEDGLFDPNLLVYRVRYLHNLKRLTFTGMDLTLDTVRQLKAERPELELRYSVNVAGIACDSTAETLNLSMLDSSWVMAAAQQLPMLINLKQVELMDGSGRCALSVSDVQRLQEAAPDVVFHYVFNLFGRTVSTTDEEIVFTDEALGQQEGAEATLRQALSILGGCKRFVLDNCKFSNELLAQLREDYRGRTKVVWRVWFARDGSCLTDRKMIRTTFNLTDANCHDLVYCEDVKYLDAGHNEQLYTCEFISGMPNLVVVILSGAPVKDLTPFKNCTKLEFLELGFCGYVRDISPLANCYSLERLNIGFTKVSDISVLDDKNMAVLVDTGTNVSNKSRQHFEALHPDCLVQHSGAQPYGHPWRYHTDKLTFIEYYQLLRDVFDYENGTNTHR